MIFALRPFLRPLRFAAAAMALVVAAAASQPSFAQSADKLDKDFEAAISALVTDHLAKHPEEVEQIVRNYLSQHPEVLQAALLSLLKKHAPARPAAAPNAGADKSAVIADNAAALFASAHQVTVGDRSGDITMVEFFDYNCGFCKRALADMVSLMKADPHLKIVLKEFPVLGSGSVEAARVAIAVRMQDAGGERYLAFHQKLLGAPGPANEARALAVAGEVGFDIDRVKRDMTSEEVSATLTENMQLAKNLGITGTPSYVIGSNVIIGAIGFASLNDKLKAVRH